MIYYFHSAVAVESQDKLILLIPQFLAPAVSLPTKALHLSGKLSFIFSDPAYAMPCEELSQFSQQNQWLPSHCGFQQHFIHLSTIHLLIDSLRSYTLKTKITTKELCLRKFCVAFVCSGPNWTQPE